MDNYDRQKGFTFIELLVVIGITIFISGFIIASYNSSAPKKNVDREVKKLVAVLEIARKSASAGALSSNPSCAAYSGFRVSVPQLSAKSYQLELCCDDKCASPTTVQTQTFSDSNISFTSAPQSVLFAPLNAGVTINPAGARYSLKQNQTGECRSVEVSQGGIVDIKDSC